eukprot:m.343840 g.343840  ORF g.343840 m.343840 type:complete len:935 (-) comp23434_c0_seq1:140-2944(-)
MYSQFSILVTFLFVCVATGLQWGQIKSAGTTSCLDSNAGSTLIDTYDCVSQNASDIINEAFSYTSTDKTLRVQTHQDLCVSSEPCEGAKAGTLCAVECTTTTTWLQHTINTSSFKLSPSTQPTLCLALSATGLSQQSCANTETDNNNQIWTLMYLPPPPPPPTLTVNIDGKASGLPYDGHGLLSAGASSRLLRDYKDPYRSQILDYLFKPYFGASLHQIKVEIGGDCQSTSGTEASHMHEKDDINCKRGYEGWLMAEAKKRNPNIKTWGLSWGVPAWIADEEPTYFSDSNIYYQTQWLKCMNESYGIMVDTIGIWNERPYGPLDYTIKLRESLDNAGFHNTGIVLPDGRISDELVTALLTNETFSKAVKAVGQHGCGHKTWTSSATFPQPFWCTESEVSNGWPAAQSWGPTINNNFLNVNQTSTTSWSLIWSVPSAVSPYQGRGAMMASQPWSGHYFVDGTIWMHAHWTQFTEIGWKILNTNTGSSGYFPDGSSSYVTIVSPDMKDYTIVICHLHGEKSDFNVNINVANLPNKTVAVWRTMEDAQFQNIQNITPTNNIISISIEYGSIYTLSTLLFAKHGNFTEVVPNPGNFTVPYTDNFDNYENDTLPLYFADQGGSFSVLNNNDDVNTGVSGGVLAQVVTRRSSITEWINTPDPITLLGDSSLSNIAVSVSAMIPQQYQTHNKADPPLTLQACTKAQTQYWARNDPSPGYFRNNASGECLNQIGCGDNAAVIQYACEMGINAGCPEYPNLSNLRWTLSQNGALIVNVTGQCATAQSDGTVSTSNCESPLSPSQQWIYNTQTGALQNQGKCLSVPPLRTYAAVCANVTSLNPFGNTMDATCLKIFPQRQGLQSSDFVLSRAGEDDIIGNLSSSVVFNDWYTLSLRIGSDNSATASVNGDVVAISKANKGTLGGSTALGSGYHIAYFDNFSITV